MSLVRYPVGGGASLGADGTITAAQLPALAIAEYLGGVASQAAMLALTGQRGDWATRSDRGTDWQLIADTPTLLASWREMTYPASPVSSVAGRTGAVVLAKGDVGLGSADNTADTAKPVSTVTQTALDGKQPLDADLTTIAGLTATTDNTIQSVAGAWASRTPAQLKTTLTLAKGDVGLGSVDNTADTAKPVSTAQQTALDGKQSLDADLTAIAAQTATTDNVIQSVSGAWASRTPAQLKTTLALAKGDVGLGSVDNTSDVDKPVSTAQAVADAGAAQKSSNLSDLASAATARTNLGVAQALTPTATKTAGYTAAAGNLVVCDATSAAFTVTLPAASAGALIAVRKDDTSVNAVTVARNGSDVFGAVNTVTSLTLDIPRQVVVLVGVSGAWIPSAGIPTPRTLPDIQVFTTSGTWTKPAGATRVQVALVSGGAGGGSGARLASGTASSGGAGGAGTGFALGTFRAADLGATEAVTVGTGGTGGAAVTTDSTNGNAGGTGAASQFGTTARCRATSCTGGAGGNTGTATGGAVAGALTLGTGGGNGNAGAAGTGSNAAGFGASGGGGGGGVSATPTATAGGSAGGVSNLAASTVAGGAVNTAGGVGASGTANSATPGQGGSGGGASITAAAGAGGTGGSYGAGGGGGGASLNGFNSGKGGDGAPGIVVVISD